MNDAFSRETMTRKNHVVALPMISRLELRSLSASQFPRAVFIHSDDSRFSNYPRVLASWS